MKLALQHTIHASGELAGIFIESSSVKIWLEEITRMRIQLSTCHAYPCPGKTPNSIAGLLLILKKIPKQLAINQHVYVQKIAENLYIPEHTKLNMVLTESEYNSITQGTPHFFHQELGMMELIEKMSWERILNPPIAKKATIQEPSKGVKIPMEISTFSIEISEKEEAASLGNPFADDQAIDEKNLPFDMKKVLEGNNAEVEKYLKYLEKNPEAALKLAIPLDMMGTSRGKSFAKFKFKSSIFDAVGLGNVSEKTKTTLKSIVGILAIIFLFWIGSIVIDNLKANEITEVSTTRQFTADQVEEMLTNNENSNSIEEEVLENEATNSEYYLIIGVLVAVIVILFIIQQRKKEQAKNASWLDSADDDDFFAFRENEDSKYYFGGDELTFVSKFVIFCMILGLIIYLFYPMITSGSFGNVFALLAAYLTIRLLYRLVRKDKKLTDD